MGAFDFDESAILVELYGQVLEANGYTVQRTQLTPGTREIIEPALASGSLDFVPEYLASDESFEAKAAGVESKASGDPAATQKALQALIAGKNLTVLDYAPAVDTNGFVVTKATADKYKLAKMSDLQPVFNQLVIGAPAECPIRPFCALGLKQVYGIGDPTNESTLGFKDWKKLGTEAARVDGLDSGDIDLGLLFTTNPNVTLKGYVLLDDDKHLQLADNVAPIVRNDILTRAPDMKQLVNGVSAKITTAELTDMNKQVGNDHKDAKDVAKTFLTSKGLLK